jgi:hypothetical protein
VFDLSDFFDQLPEAQPIDIPSWLLLGALIATFWIIKRMHWKIAIRHPLFLAALMSAALPGLLRLFVPMEAFLHHWVLNALDMMPEILTSWLAIGAAAELAIPPTRRSGRAALLLVISMIGGIIVLYAALAYQGPPFLVGLLAKHFRSAGDVLEALRGILFVLALLACLYAVWTEFQRQSRQANGFLMSLTLILVLVAANLQMLFIRPTSSVHDIENVSLATAGITLLTIGSLGYLLTAGGEQGEISETQVRTSQL